MSDFVVAIPARYASTRFPGKAVAQVGGVPMIKRVVLQALRSGAKKVYACVDDDRIARVLDGTGACVVMTSTAAKSGTDRIAEMIKKEGLAADEVVVNVQGDEPLINPDHINKVAATLRENDADMATLCFEIDNDKDLFDPSCVKVVCNKKGMAMYFSRAPIPYERDNFMNDLPSTFKHYHHIGIYAYKAATILKFQQLPQSVTERAENLEQLRLLEEGMSIAVAKVADPPETGIDTPEDLERINKILAAWEAK